MRLSIIILIIIQTILLLGFCLLFPTGLSWLSILIFLIIGLITLTYSIKYSKQQGFLINLISSIIVLVIITILFFYLKNKILLIEGTPDLLDIMTIRPLSTIYSLIIFNLPYLAYFLFGKDKHQ